MTQTFFKTLNVNVREARSTALGIPISDCDE